MTAKRKPDDTHSGWVASKPAVSGRYASPVGIASPAGAVGEVVIARAERAQKQASTRGKAAAKKAAPKTTVLVEPPVVKALSNKKLPGTSANNPYAFLSPEQTLAILRQANVLTPHGRLTKVFK